MVVALSFVVLWCFFVKYHDWRAMGKYIKFLTWFLFYDSYVNLRQVHTRFLWWDLIVVLKSFLRLFLLPFLVFGDEIAIDRIHLLFCKYTIKIAIECVDTIILDMWFGNICDISCGNRCWSFVYALINGCKFLWACLVFICYLS